MSGPESYHIQTDAKLTSFGGVGWSTIALAEGFMGVIVVTHQCFEGFNINNLIMITFENLCSWAITPTEPIEFFFLFGEATDLTGFMEEWNVVGSIITIFIQISGDIFVNHKASENIETVM